MRVFGEYVYDADKSERARQSTGDKVLQHDQHGAAQVSTNHCGSIMERLRSVQITVGQSWGGSDQYKSLWVGHEVAQVSQVGHKVHNMNDHMVI